MPITRRHCLTLPFLGVAIAFLFGCVSKESADALPFEEALAFSMVGHGLEANAHWWLSLGDKGLDAAIDQALSENFSLRAAYERLRAARALARRQSAELWPELELGGSGERAETRVDGWSERESSVEFGLAAA